MIEYIALTGGRYTYADDILNLQELALSYTSLFDSCSNFIISGCEIQDGKVNPGFVWLGNKVRYFEGCTVASYPLYIYEYNKTDTTTYANDVNKRGRINYLCVSGTSVPTRTDAVTGKLPVFIEISENYAPRLLDKFFGKYAVLLDTPFSKQTVKKDLVVTGGLTTEQAIVSKTALSVFNQSKGYALKNIVKANGEGSTGLYLNGILINEIVLNTDGTFSLYMGENIIASFNENGIATYNATLDRLKVSSISINTNVIENTSDKSDNGSVNINLSGYNNENSYYRNFNIYDGKSRKTPLFSTEGKTASVKVDGNFSISGDNPDIFLYNNIYAKTDKRLLNSIKWKDANKEDIFYLGYISNDNFDFTLKNTIGNIILTPKNYFDISGEIRLNGINLSEIYVSINTFNSELSKKVSKVDGKQLSTEDFTSELKSKLQGIKTGNVYTPTEGYALVSEVIDSLYKKLNKIDNLADIPDKKTARTNLDVYSKPESNSLYLKISQNLSELVTLTADEINGLSADDINSLKANKQKAVRDNIDAEKKGTGDMKLAKASNLSDITDKTLARKNISVYSIDEVEKRLEKYLPITSEYTGAIFTQDHKLKLEAIRTGNFAGVDSENKAISQTEGYVMTSHIVKELAKKANLLLDGYNDTQKKTIAANIDVFTKAESNAKYATVEELFQDFITYLVKQGKSTSDAQKILRDKLNTPSKEDVSGYYLRKDGLLSDLSLANTEAKKTVCRTLGAAYAEEYQTKVADTGWLKMNNSGANTYASDLYIRQIGNIVSIQGTVYNNRHDGSHWGGVLAVIPNQIQPPKYAVKNSLCEFNDDHKYNRGTTYVIAGGDRNLRLYESGWYVTTELNFTYMV